MVEGKVAAGEKVLVTRGMGVRLNRMCGPLSGVLHLATCMDSSAQDRGWMRAYRGLRVGCVRPAA